MFLSFIILIPTNIPCFIMIRFININLLKYFNLSNLNSQQSFYHDLLFPDLERRLSNNRNMIKESENAKIQLVKANNKQLADIFKKLSRSIRLYDKQHFQKYSQTKQPNKTQKGANIQENLHQLKALSKSSAREKFKIRRKIVVDDSMSFQTSITNQIHNSQSRLSNRLRFNTNHKTEYSNSREQDSLYPLEDTFRPQLIHQISKKMRNAETKPIQSLKIKNFLVKKQNIKSVISNKIKLRQITKEFRRHPHSVTISHFNSFYQIKKKYLNEVIGTPKSNIFRRPRNTERAHIKPIEKIDQLQRIGTNIQYILSECSNVLESHYSELHNQKQEQRVKKGRQSSLDLQKVLQRGSSIRRITRSQLPRSDSRKVSYKEPSIQISQSLQ